MKPNAKVLFIGLDGLEPELALEMCEAGELPALQSLREKGVWGMNATVPGFGDGATWPCVFTGVNPAKHGRYFYHPIKPGTYQTFYFKNDADYKREPVWAELSRAGKRVAVIDMVQGPLTTGLNGIQISDWLVADHLEVPRSWPPELIETVIDHYGKDPYPSGTDLAGRTDADYVKLCTDMLERVETKTKMSCAYLDQGSWDLFVTVYGEAHDVGHQCWHIRDPSHPLYDPQLSGMIGDPIKQTYIQIDSGIGRLIEKAGPAATVIVVGGLGMESGYTANFLLDQILRRLETGPGTDGLTYVDTLKKIYRAVAPPAVRNLLASLGQSGEQKMLATDRRARKCFAVPHNENAGAIRINLVGRELDGKVNPSDLDAYVDALTKDLKDIVNLETGDSLVKEIIRVSDLYTGDHLDDLPDLLVLWDRPKPIRKIGSPKIGEIEDEYPGNRTGDHTNRMLMVASGPGIVPAGQIFDTSVTDIGPTIGALLGVTTQDMDGKVIPQLAATE